MAGQMPRNNTTRDSTSARVLGISLSNNKPAKPHVTRVTATPSADTNGYTIKAITSNKSRFAGTDANVFITLYGSKGMSKELHLKKSLDHDDPFEKGHTDTFKLNTKELGCLYKIKIRHDNSGWAPGWLLSKIIVQDEVTKLCDSFSCNQWLFKSSSQNDLGVELEVDGLPVVSLDPLVEENSVAHHTAKFSNDTPTLIVRRGQTFRMMLQLARPYQPDDSFYFTLTTGSRPRDKDKTMITVVEVLPKEFEAFKAKEKWGFTIRDITDSKNVLLEIYIPHNALPAKYNIVTDTDDGTVFRPEFSICVLFNPWCSQDEVYMEDEEKLKEYVLRQHGLVYVGNWRNPQIRKWYFGQFEQVSLDAAFYILNTMKAHGRDSAIQVSRQVSSMVNSNDNDGVVIGNWSGDYEDGKSPTFWKSTPAILESYMNNQQPVKYGQCWVFSCTVTTIMRTLGIPCRSVSNFSSAHDSNGNCTNDKYFDENGEEIDDIADDSVWNFHVWNDAWMARPDLPIGYGGWQTIDATPQEMSQGFFQLGPASLRAVKEGEIHLGFDTAFVLAEVNADTVYWKKGEDGKFNIIYRSRTRIGKKVSTKAVGKDEREDITDLYKFPEGSVLERGAVRKALLKAGNEAAIVTRQDVQMELAPEKDDINAGEDACLLVKLKNTCSEDLRISLVVAGQIVRYNGVAKGKLEKFKKTLELKANSSEEIPVKVKSASFTSMLEDDTMLRFLATVRVAKTDQFLVDDEIINIVKPDLNIENAPKTLQSGKDASFLVSFKNPLDKELTKCELYVDGTIIKNRIYMKELKNVPAHGLFKQKISLKPDIVGGEKYKSIMVSFCCEQLGGIQADTKLLVKDA